jgi:hypothetical protein
MAVQRVYLLRIIRVASCLLVVLDDLVACAERACAQPSAAGNTERSAWRVKQ